MGETVWVPPVDERVKLLPSVPVTVTCVALVAAELRRAEPPGEIELGLEPSVTVGAEGGGATMPTLEPQPVHRTRKSEHTNTHPAG